MINTLKIATSGYLRRTAKVALVIAISGYLNFNEAVSTTTQVVHGTEIIKQPHKFKNQRKNLKRQIKVTITKDGVDHVEYAYTSDLTVTVNNVTIELDEQKSNKIKILVNNVQLN